MRALSEWHCTYVDASAEASTTQGLTFDELLERSPVDDELTLRRVLRDELEAGRIEYSPAWRRFVLNGGLPHDVKAALVDLDEL
jgi:hypothetical protein